MDNDETKFLIKDGEDWFELAPPDGHLVPLPMVAVPPEERDPTHFHDVWEIAIGKMIEAMPDHFRQERLRIDFVSPPRFVAPWMHMGGLVIEAPIRPPIHLSFDCTDLQKSMDNLAVAARAASVKLGGISRIMMTPINSFHYGPDRSSRKSLRRDRRDTVYKKRSSRFKKLMRGAKEDMVWHRL